MLVSFDDSILSIESNKERSEGIDESAVVSAVKVDDKLSTSLLDISKSWEVEVLYLSGIKSTSGSESDEVNSHFRKKYLKHTHFHLR